MKEEKALVIDTIREWVKSSPYLIVLDYTGMKVAEFSELRAALKTQPLSSRYNPAR